MLKSSVSVTDLAASDSSLLEPLLEPFAGELEPFLVYSRIDIFATLRLLIDQHVLVTVYFSQGKNFIVTRLLSINPDTEMLIFDHAIDERTNQKLQGSNSLTLVAFLDHIKIQFTVDRPSLTLFEGSEAFKVQTPRSMLRLQRRTAFRAHTKLALSPYIVLPLTIDRNNKLVATKARIVDISATGFAFVAPKGHPVLSIGMRLVECLLELEANKSFKVDVELRHISVFKDGFGREMCRIGCRLMRESADMQMSIQRFVNQLEVSGRSNC